MLIVYKRVLVNSQMLLRAKLNNNMGQARTIKGTESIHGASFMMHYLQFTPMFEG